MKRRKELVAQENGRNCTSARFWCITKSSSEYREGKEKGRNDLFQGGKSPSFTNYLNEKKSKIKVVACMPNDASSEQEQACTHEHRRAFLLSCIGAIREIQGK